MNYMSAPPQADQPNELAHCTRLEGETMNQATDRDTMTVGPLGVRSQRKASGSNGNVAAAAFVIFNVVAAKDPE
jgi:hypothetical protein